MHDLKEMTQHGPRSELSLSQPLFFVLSSVSGQGGKLLPSFLYIMANKLEDKILFHLVLE